MNFDLKSAYNSAAYSDLTIASNRDGLERRVHKFVLAGASPFFNSIIQADSPGDSIIAVPERGIVIDALLGFMYGHPLDIVLSARPGVVDFKVYAELIETAETYAVKGFADPVVENAIQAMPALPLSERAKVAAMFYGGDPRGRVIRSLLTGTEKIQDSITVDQTPTPTVSQPAPKRKRSPTPGPDTLPTIKPETARASYPAATRAAADQDVKHCICRTHAQDPLLLQCDGCDKWYHPGCIGKGLYSPKSYEKNRDWAQKRDLKHFKDPERHFFCRECDAPFR